MASQGSAGLDGAAGEERGGMAEQHKDALHPQSGRYLLGLEAEPRALLVLPVWEQTSSCPQSSISVQRREQAIGWGNDPVCRLGPSQPLTPGGP